MRCDTPGAPQRPTDFRAHRFPRRRRVAPCRPQSTTTPPPWRTLETKVAGTLGFANSQQPISKRRPGFAGLVRPSGDSPDDPPSHSRKTNKITSWITRNLEPHQVREHGGRRVSPRGWRTLWSTRFRCGRWTHPSTRGAQTGTEYRGSARMRRSPVTQSPATAGLETGL